MSGVKAMCPTPSRGRVDSVSDQPVATQLTAVLLRY